MKKSIGILAGMGPRSTSPFIELVLDQCQIQYGAKYDIDYPAIMIYSLPTPFYLDRPIDHDEMKKTIIKGLQHIEATGVNYIAMPCNSAHIYFNELKKEINIPILNIIDETIKKIGSNRKITIFATETTFNSGLYQEGISTSDNQFIFKDSWQERINTIIQMIKETRELYEIGFYWDELIKDAIETDVVDIIIACTDLSVLKNNFSDKINFIDSSQVLAESVVKEYLKY
ncbi:aspartate/glutamate racemase family protein [Serpentinicella alkaliphila]|uniref:Aspartate racemase n=1 Tax=Serpentinicella alkaliphila TaxID=1734049 RepID=A0A4R2SYV5_9FIRM|nr:amino acid racemase [Serpentinicella alkaliphila]QUH26159.1 amino acid racemase [Serpentinicella alkaliphila]TCP94695.1 aspartate racemase [Serpentinicella alkaliphila]